MHRLKQPSPLEESIGLDWFSQLGGQRSGADGGRAGSIGCRSACAGMIFSFPPHFLRIHPEMFKNTVKESF